MVFRQLKFEVFEEQSVNPVDTTTEQTPFTVKLCSISNLTNTIVFSYPLNLRGFITHTRPTNPPMGFDFNLYLRENTGNRFNRFTLKGIGAENDEDFFEENRILNNTFNYIKKLFCETHIIRFPNPTNATMPLCQFEVKVYDEIRVADTLASIVACSFGGFKCLASSNLKR
uniref:Putative encoded protein n=1 Tax=Dunaliella salina TaxID=3046 RepID=A0A1C8XRR4_DUNSA|nr:putative encoded protein [Dunaliella salina]